MLCNLRMSLSSLSLVGKNFEKVCEMCHITLNKIAIFDDNGTITPGGVRIGKWRCIAYNLQFVVFILLCFTWLFAFIMACHMFFGPSGTPAMTSRGCLEADFETMADFLLRVVQITSTVQREHGKLQKAFLNGLQNNKDIVELRTQVEDFATQFALPGLDWRKYTFGLTHGSKCCFTCHFWYFCTCFCCSRLLALSKLCLQTTHALGV